MCRALLCGNWWWLIAQPRPIWKKAPPGLRRPSRADSGISGVLYWPNPSDPHLGPDPSFNSFNVNGRTYVAGWSWQRADIVCIACHSSGPIDVNPGEFYVSLRYVTLLKKYSCNFFQLAIWKGSFWSIQIINHRWRFLASYEDQDGKNWKALKYFSLSYRNDWGRPCRHLQKVSWRQWRTSCFKIATTVQNIILNQIYYLLMGSLPFKNQVQLQSFPAWHFWALLLCAQSNKNMKYWRIFFAT